MRFAVHAPMRQLKHVPRPGIGISWEYAHMIVKPNILATFSQITGFPYKIGRIQAHGTRELHAGSRNEGSVQPWTQRFLLISMKSHIIPECTMKDGKGHPKNPA
jgi:hypothetical protein